MTLLCGFPFPVPSTVTLTLFQNLSHKPTSRPVMCNSLQIPSPLPDSHSAAYHWQVHRSFPRLGSLQMWEKRGSNMKRIVFPILMIVVVVATVSVSTKAQSFGPTGIRSDVPFDFIVGDTLIRSGKVLTYGSEFSQNAGPLSITNLTSKQNIRYGAQRMIETSPSNEAKLVFRRYGNRYYLAEVWVPGYRGWAIQKSDRERAESQLSMRTTRPRVVTIIAQIM